MRILVISPVDDDALAALRQRHELVCALNPRQEELAGLARGCEALVFRSGVQVDAEVMEQAPDLKFLIRAGSGTDNIDLEQAERRGIALLTIPQPGARAVAEMTFALLLGVARNIRTADALLREGRWAKKEMIGRGISGKTLGIVGAGNIGTMVGQMAVAWDMRVLGCVKTPSPAVAERLSGHGIELTELDPLLERADYVSLHVPLNDSTRHLIDGKALARMKPGACLTNLARGGVVDEAALHEALTTGHLMGAALDVHAREGGDFASPLVMLPNVILTPHIGASTVEAQKEIGARIVEAIETFAAESPARRPPAIRASA